MINSRFFAQSCLWGLLVGGVLGASAGWLSGGADSRNDLGSNHPEAMKKVRPPAVSLKKRTGKNAETHDLEYFLSLPDAQFPAELEKRLKAVPDNLPALSLLFEVWASKDPGAALSAWEKLPSRKRGICAVGIFEGWVAAEPDAALAYLVDQRKSRGELGPAMDAMLPVIADASPEKALPWLRQFSGRKKTELMQDFFSLRLSQSLEAAVSLYNELSPEERRHVHAPEKIALHLGERNWDEAARWIETQPEEDRKDLLFEALSGLGMKNPEAMKEKLSLIPAGKEKDDFLSYLSGGLSLSGGTPVMELEDVMGMQKLFHDPLRARKTVLMASQKLAGNNPSKLLAVTDALPDGELKDTFRANYAKHNTKENIKERLDVLSHLEGSAPQRNVAENLLESWKDTATALKWIESAPVSQKCRDKWKEQVKRAASR